jgi:hypothetical protein
MGRGPCGLRTALIVALHGKLCAPANISYDRQRRMYRRAGIRSWRLSAPVKGQQFAPDWQAVCLQLLQLSGLCTLHLSGLEHCVPLWAPSSKVVELQYDAPGTSCLCMLSLFRVRVELMMV